MKAHRDFCRYYYLTPCTRYTVPCCIHPQIPNPVAASQSATCHWNCVLLNIFGKFSISLTFSAQFSRALHLPVVCVPSMNYKFIVLFSFPCILLACQCSWSCKCLLRFAIGLRNSQLWLVNYAQVDPETVRRRRRHQQRSNSWEFIEIWAHLFII